MRFGIWNIGSLNSAESLKTFAKEPSKYKLELVAVQEARWRDAICLWKGEENHE
jgi:hypothetical protein